MKKRKAIILAAGIGSRLRPLTENMPKCMVEVNNESLIHRIVKQLINNERVEEVIILCGYKADILVKHVSELGLDNIKFINNEVFDTTNNMYSLSLALNCYDGDAIIINADCIYDDLIVKSVCEVDASTIFIDKSRNSEESMKVKVVNDIMVEMSKAIPLDVSFSSIDIYYFVKEDLAKLKGIITAYIAGSQLNLWTEYAINDLLQLHPGLISFKDIAQNKWYEIDDLNDLTLASDLFLNS